MKNLKRVAAAMALAGVATLAPMSSASAAQPTAADKAIAEASKVCAKVEGWFYAVTDASYGTQYDCLNPTKPLTLNSSQQARLEGGCDSRTVCRSWHR